MRELILSGSLPPGARVRALQTNADERGDLHELSRESWPASFPVAQWNAMQSQAGTLRGLSVHRRMTEFYVNALGEALLGLADLRPGIGGVRASCVISLRAERPAAVTIPAGVAHGIYCVSDCLTLGALDAVHDPEDKLGCRWDDPLLGIPWPSLSPRLLERDRDWPPAHATMELIARSFAVPA